MRSELGRSPRLSPHLRDLRATRPEMSADKYAGMIAFPRVWSARPSSLALRRPDVLCCSPAGLGAGLTSALTIPASPRQSFLFRLFLAAGRRVLDALFTAGSGAAILYRVRPLPTPRLDRPRLACCRDAPNVAGLAAECWQDWSARRLRRDRDDAVTDQSTALTTLLDRPLARSGGSAASSAARDAPALVSRRHHRSSRFSSAPTAKLRTPITYPEPDRQYLETIDAFAPARKAAVFASSSRCLGVITAIIRAAAPGWDSATMQWSRPRS